MRRTLTYVVLGTVLIVGGIPLLIPNWVDAAKSEWISFASNRTGDFDIYAEQQTILWGRLKQTDN